MSQMSFAISEQDRPRPAPRQRKAAETARPSATKASTPAGFGSALSRMGRRAARKPLRSLVQVSAFGVALFIIVNAVGLQQARHPAPLGQSREAVAGAEMPPLPPMRPAQFTAAGAPAQGGLAQSVAEPAQPSHTLGSQPRREQAPPRREPTQAMPAAQPAAPQTARSGDPIGDLIRGGDLPPASIPRVREPAQPVLAAQRALAKLGYAQVKPDGVAGESTRVAIERFERERKLPVTGQLNPRTLRELAAASGMKIE